MGKDERLKLIKKIEKARGSRVICYLTSTRPNLEVQMVMDQVRRIYDHLQQIASNGNKPKIDLFIHSNGGEGIVPWRLVTLIREYTNQFSVLVPFRAFSAATLTALGADKVVMHPMGMLGPTDPTVANEFNPVDPKAGKRLGISVEDVTAYIALIKEDAGITHEDELVVAFNKLAEQVHPLALGNVKRSLSQSRMMAEKLLRLHMDPKQDEHQINEIVDSLTSKLYFHGHPINRTEAQEHIGLKTIEKPTAVVERAMWDLYLEYEDEMKLDSRFDIPAEFLAAFPALAAGASDKTPSVTAKLGFVESTDRTDAFSMDYELVGTKQPNGVTSVTLIISRQSWKKE
jgi:hypothetical protein